MSEVIRFLSRTSNNGLVTKATKLVNAVKREKIEGLKDFNTVYLSLKEPLTNSKDWAKAKWLRDRTEKLYPLILQLEVIEYSLILDSYFYTPWIYEFFFPFFDKGNDELCEYSEDTQGPIFEDVILKRLKKYYSPTRSKNMYKKFLDILMIKGFRIVETLEGNKICVEIGNTGVYATLYDIFGWVRGNWSYYDQYLDIIDELNEDYSDNY